MSTRFHSNLLGIKITLLILNDYVILLTVFRLKSWKESGKLVRGPNRRAIIFI